MAADLVWRLTGGAANADPALSLGGTRSATELPAVALGNLFDDVAFWESLAGRVEYRALDLANVGDAAASGVAVWLDPNTTSEDTTLDLGSSGLESSLAIADEATAPADVTFAEATPAAKLALPEIPAGQGCRVWWRRTVTAEAAQLAEDMAWIFWEYA